MKNRQISCLKGTTAATYTYHPDNLRKTKTVNGATTNFVWADGNLVHEFTNTSTKTYFYAIILVSDSAGQAYLYNTHGDVIKLIGTLTWNYQYDAYGVQQNPDPLDGNAFRYAGQYFDIESGTYYLRARYYNPNSGRFTQPDQHWNISNSLYGDDPLKLNGYTVPSIAAVMQSTNRYAYCMGNPVLYVDQTGDMFLLLAAAIGLGVGAAFGALYSYSKYGEVHWQNVAIGAVVGGVIGLGGGALAGVAFAGSATASTSAVLSGIALASGSTALEATTTTINSIAESSGKAFRAFTQANFRYNLQQLTGEIGKGLQAHHVLPQKFIDQFSALGINIHDPIFGAWVDSTHQSWSLAYNNAWTEFFRQNATPTIEQILDKAAQLAQEFGFSIQFK